MGGGEKGGALGLVAGIDAGPGLEQGLDARRVVFGGGLVEFGFGCHGGPRHCGCENQQEKRADEIVENWHVVGLLRRGTLARIVAINGIDPVAVKRM